MSPFARLNGRTLLDVDLDALLRGVLFSEELLIETFRFQDLAWLVNELGYEAIFRLLASDAVKLKLDILEPASTGQAVFETRSQHLPLNTLEFSLIDFHSREDYVSDCFKVFDHLNLTTKQKIKFKHLILEKLLPRPEGMRHFFRGFTEDLVLDRGLLARTIANKARDYDRTDREEPEIEIKKVSPDTVTIVSNLQQILRISPQEEHALVESSCLAVASLRLRISEMASYNAITGFLPSEFQLFDQQTAAILLRGKNLFEREQDQFMRVRTIAGLPSFHPSAFKSGFSIERLLDLRCTQEISEFRAFLKTAEVLDDEQVANQLKNTRARIGNLVDTAPGKLMRVAVATTLGLTLGDVIGVAAGVVDSLLLDKVFPRSGLVAFVSDLYPSLFRD